jgi:ABC-type nitrate/sulfonate/bicarbonate transport system substrate-binding protein
MPTRTHLALVVASIATLAVALTGCSSGASTTSASSTKSAGDISAARCAENKAAGEITYLTGYQYQASASILEQVAAKQLGYFDDLCLNVKIQAGTGDTGQNTKLLASGRVTLTGVSEQDLLTAQANGLNITGVSTYSDVGLDVLITQSDVTKLTQLDNTTLGQKGSMPASVSAMLTKAGADVSTIKQVVVGYDPTVLTRGQVKSLTGFISNEPNTLKAAGKKITVWRPYDYGIAGSLGSIAVNPAFAKKNPTAVEDFLRASQEAYQYCSTKVTECVGFASKLSGAGYDVAHNEQVWKTEIGVVKDNQPATRPLGLIDLKNVDSEAAFLVSSKQLKSAVADPESYFDNSYITTIYSGTKLIWPAP